MDNKLNKDKESSNQKKQLKQIAALSGIAMQMGITIYLFVMLGDWLSSKYQNTGKLFLIVCTLLGVGISLYVVVKQTNKLNS